MQNKNPETYPPKPEGGRHGGGQMPRSGVWPGGDPRRVLGNTKKHGT